MYFDYIDYGGACFMSESDIRQLTVRVFFSSFSFFFFLRFPFPPSHPFFSQATGDTTQCVDLYGCPGCISAPPPLPPMPPLPPASSSGACRLVTHRWPLNSVSADGAIVMDVVGNWNGTAVGRYTYIADNSGAISLDGYTGYIDLGPRTVGGGAMSWAFWAEARVDVNPWVRFFDWGNGPSHDNLYMVPYAVRGGKGDRPAALSPFPIENPWLFLFF